MARILALLYRIVCYLLFLAVFEYAMRFIVNNAVPKSIDSGPAEPLRPQPGLDAIQIQGGAIAVHQGLKYFIHGAARLKQQVAAVFQLIDRVLITRGGPLLILRVKGQT